MRAGMAGRSLRPRAVAAISARKFETRISKSETRIKRGEYSKHAFPFCHLPLGNSILFRVSCFDIRIFRRSATDRILPILVPLSLSWLLLRSGIELHRSLKMFLGELGHPEVLEPQGDHPMIESVVRVNLSAGFFVRASFLESPNDRSRRRCDCWSKRVWIGCTASSTPEASSCGPAARETRIFPSARIRSPARQGLHRDGRRLVERPGGSGLCRGCRGQRLCLPFWWAAVAEQLDVLLRGPESIQPRRFGVLRCYEKAGVAAFEMLFPSRSVDRQPAEPRIGVAWASPLVGDLDF